MANLYQHTNNLQYIRDLVLLESEAEAKLELSLKEKVEKLPKHKKQSIIDDYSTEDTVPKKMPGKTAKFIDELLADNSKNKTDAA